MDKSFLIDFQVGPVGWPGIDSVQVAVEVLVGDHHEHSSSAARASDEPCCTHARLRVRLEYRHVHVA